MGSVCVKSGPSCKHKGKGSSGRKYVGDTGRIYVSLKNFRDLQGLLLTRCLLISEGEML